MSWHDILAGSITWLQQCCIITGELAKAIRNNTDMHFGLYYSLFDFFHPLYLEDQANGFTTQNYVNVSVPVQGHRNRGASPLG